MKQVALSFLNQYNTLHTFKALFKSCFNTILVCTTTSESVLLFEVFSQTCVAYTIFIVSPTRAACFAISCSLSLLIPLVPTVEHRITF
jgi:hypothetical protein